MKYTNEPVRNNIISAAVKAGLLAGSFDLLIALVQYYSKTGKNALVVLKYIAGAVFGKAAFTGGYGMAVIGLAFHFIIAIAWAIFFFLIYPVIPALAKSKIITASLFGIFIWLVMNLAIVPMTNVPDQPFNLGSAITGAIILVLAMGLPITIIANKYYSKKFRIPSDEW